MKKSLFLIGVLVLSLTTYAQGQDKIPKYKSIFTLSFMRYVGWPEETRQGDFVIGVVKDKQVAEWLRNLSKGKKFGFQNVIIKEFKSPNDITDCQVLFVSQYINLSKYASTIVDKIGGKNTLIVSERNGATKYGSMINFVIKDDKLKFEIHKANASKFGLQISSKLGGMASAITL
jgi:hypothetical protein